MKLTFKRGIHPRGMKSLSKNCKFEEMPTGEKVYIPMAQHIGAPAINLLEPGDYVKVGTKIGEANGNVSANIHSSVSGKFINYVMRENPQGRRVCHAIIENDGLYEEEFLPPLVNPQKADIIKRVRDAGIVGMGGATFPTHIKLEASNDIKALIINGSECEPYITTDHRMMVDMADDVMKGIKHIQTALGAERVLIGIEANKPEAIKNMAEASKAYDDVTVYSLKTKYPQGGEKQLIYAMTREKVPNGGLPSDLGYIVLNISTAYAIYEAVDLGKPSFSRYMTISGKGIKRPANLHVRNGVPFQEVINYLGENPGYVKAVSGGPMMGVSLANLSAVVSKGTSALLLLNRDEIRKVEPTTCINCGRCAHACPIGLLPMMTDALILKGKVEEAKQYYPMSCIECGCCAYVCPAKRPLVQSQRLAKKMIREQGRK